MAIQRFEDILAWQKSREVVRDIYKISSYSEFYSDSALRNQLRRSAVSIMANIAEGFNRNSRKEFLRFLTISLGSVSETKSHLYVALDQTFISEPIFHKTYESLDEIARLISGLMNYLRSAQAKTYDEKKNAM